MTHVRTKSLAPTVRNSILIGSIAFFGSGCRALPTPAVPTTKPTAAFQSTMERSAAPVGRDSFSRAIADDPPIVLQTEQLVTPTPHPPPFRTEIVDQKGVGWGGVLGAAGEDLLIGAGPRLYRFSLADGVMPRLISSSDVLPGLIQSMAVDGRYAYLGTNQGLCIVDLDDNMHVIGGLEIPGIDEVIKAGDSVVLHGDAEFRGRGNEVIYGGLWIVNAQDPRQPLAVARLDGPGRAFPFGRWLYVLDSGVLTLDMSNPDQPRPLPLAPWAIPPTQSLDDLCGPELAAADIHRGTASGSRLILYGSPDKPAWESRRTAVCIIDMKDAPVLRPLASFVRDNPPYSRMVALDDILLRFDYGAIYASKLPTGTRSGANVIPSERLVDRLGNSKSYVGTVTRVKDSIAFAVDRNYYLADFRNPNQPVIAGPWSIAQLTNHASGDSDPARYSDLAIADRHQLYAVRRDGAIERFTLTRLPVPSLVRDWTRSVAGAAAIAVDGDTLVVASEGPMESNIASRLEMFDVAGPQPEALGVNEMVDSGCGEFPCASIVPLSIDLGGGLARVNYARGGPFVFDLQDRHRPRMLGETDDGVTVDRLSDGTWLDSMVTTRWLGTGHTPHWNDQPPLTGVQSWRDRLYLVKSAYSNGVPNGKCVHDTEVPCRVEVHRSPYVPDQPPLASLDLDLATHQAFSAIIHTAGQDWLLVAGADPGLHVIALADPDRPALAGFIRLPGDVDGLAVDGSLIYVAVEGAGLMVLDTRAD